MPDLRPRFFRLLSVEQQPAPIPEPGFRSNDEPFLRSEKPFRPIFQAHLRYAHVISFAARDSNRADNRLSIGRPRRIAVRLAQWTRGESALVRAIHIGDDQCAYF